MVSGFVCASLPPGSRPLKSTAFFDGLIGVFCTGGEAPLGNIPNSIHVHFLKKLLKKLVIFKGRRYVFTFNFLTAYYPFRMYLY